MVGERSWVVRRKRTKEVRVNGRKALDENNRIGRRNGMDFDC